MRPGFTVVAEALYTSGRLGGGISTGSNEQRRRFQKYRQNRSSHKPAITAVMVDGVIVYGIGRSFPVDLKSY